MVVWVHVMSLCDLWERMQVSTGIQGEHGTPHGAGVRGDRGPSDKSDGNEPRFSARAAGALNLRVTSPA